MRLALILSVFILPILALRAADAVTIDGGGAVTCASSLSATGLTATNLTGGRVVCTATGGALSDSGSLMFNGSTLTIGAGSGAPGVMINGGAGNLRYFAFRTGGVNRWAVFADSSMESGSNAGSDLIIRADSDAGAEIDTPLKIARASGGVITLARPVACSSAMSAATVTASSRMAVTGASYNSTYKAGAGWVWDSVGNGTGSVYGGIYGQVGALKLFGGASPSGTATGVVKCLDTTPSTSPTTGSLVVSGGLGVAGSGYFGADVMVTSAASNRFLTISSAAATYRGMYISTAGSQRWLVGGNNAVESGSNAGTDFSVMAYSDAAALIDTPLKISRVSGGAISLARPVTCTSTLTASDRINAQIASASTNCFYGTNASTATSAATFLELKGDQPAYCDIGLYNSTYSTTRFGQNVANWGCVGTYGTNCNGLIVGCNTIDKPLRFGINNMIVGEFTNGTVGTGAMKVNYTTPSTSPMSGALVVAGGVGIGGNINQPIGTTFLLGDLTLSSTASGSSKISSSTLAGSNGNLVLDVANSKTGYLMHNGTAVLTWGASGVSLAQPAQTAMTSAIASSSVSAQGATLTANPTAASSASFNAGNFLVQSGGAQNFTASNGLVGVVGEADHYGTGTVADMYGGRFIVIARPGCGNVTSQTAASFRSYNMSSSTVANSIGAYVQSPVNSGGGSITTNYGLRIDDQTAGVTNYAIYAGAGVSKFNDVTPSTSPTTGALVVAGGVGVSGQLSASSMAAYNNSASLVTAMRLRNDNAGGAGALGGVQMQFVTHDGSAPANNGFMGSTHGVWSYGMYPANSFYAGGERSGGVTIVASHASGSLRFGAGGDQASNVRMTINSAGSAMIGTTTDGMTAGGSLKVAKDLVTKGQRVVQVRSVASAGSTTALDGTDDTVVITGSSAQTVTLPAASNGRLLRIKNRSTGTVTVNRAGSDTIDGGTSITLTANQAAVLVANSTDWVRF